MLSKPIARGLLPLVNTDLNDVLIEYAKYRIELLAKLLEQSTDLHEILRVQGQIKELRRLFDLRNEAVHDAKE